MATRIGPGCAAIGPGSAQMPRSGTPVFTVTDSLCIIGGIVASQEGASSGEQVVAAGRHRRHVETTHERRAPRMAGGLALLGLGAMLAVPADAPTSLAEGGRSANSVERPARVPDRAAPAPRAARPQSNEQRPSRLPSAASLRIGGGTHRCGSVEARRALERDPAGNPAP